LQKKRQGGGRLKELRKRKPKRSQRGWKQQGLLRNNNERYKRRKREDNKRSVRELKRK